MVAHSTEAADTNVVPESFKSRHHENTALSSFVSIIELAILFSFRDFKSCQKVECVSMSIYY